MIQEKLKQLADDLLAFAIIAVFAMIVWFAFFGFLILAEISK